VNVLDPNSLLETFGAVGVLFIIFAETGLLIGFFLPGDTLLFTGGFFASGAAVHTQVELSLPLLLVGAPLCAIAGAQVGHYLGLKAGPSLMNRPNAKLLTRDRMEKAEFYFRKFGPFRSVIVARFIPIVRTFLNPVAGMLGMSAGRFLVANVIGAILWTDGVLLLGYYLGALIPNIEIFILPVVAVVVLASVGSVVFELIRGRKNNDRARPTGRHAAGRGGSDDGAQGETVARPSRGDGR